MLAAEDEYTVVVALILALVLLVQLLLCFKVKRISVRLIPCIGLLALTVFFFVMIFCSSGWDSLGYVILTVYSAYMLIMSGIGWGIWLVAYILKRSRSKSNPKSLE